eukprot:scaffold5295_cov85-Isochrysis_galbana.AAC.4
MPSGGWHPLRGAFAALDSMLGFLTPSALATPPALSRETAEQFGRRCREGWEGTWGERWGEVPWGRGGGEWDWNADLSSGYIPPVPAGARAPSGLSPMTSWARARGSASSSAPRRRWAFLFIHVPPRSTHRGQNMS